jgi:hypothetical protein
MLNVLLLLLPAVTTDDDRDPPSSFSFFSNWSQKSLLYQLDIATTAAT